MYVCNHRLEVGRLWVTQYIIDNYLSKRSGGLQAAAVEFRTQYHYKKTDPICVLSFLRGMYLLAIMHHASLASSSSEISERWSLIDRMEDSEVERKEPLCTILLHLPGVLPADSSKVKGVRERGCEVIIKSAHRQFTTINTGYMVHGNNRINGYTSYSQGYTVLLHLHNINLHTLKKYTTHTGSSSHALKEKIDNKGR